VRPEQQVRLRTDRLAQDLAEALAEVERRQRQLPAVERRVGPGRVELDGRETLAHVLGRADRRQLRVLVHVDRVAGPGIDIGVRAQPLVHAPAEQLVDRLAGLLADDVPARHLERAQHAHQRQVRVLRETRGVDAPPHALDVMRILAGEVAREDVLDELRDEVRLEGHAVRLADARDVAVRRQLHEHEVAAAVVRRRVADDEGADVGELHGLPQAA
jgi:hypothetical protein